MTDLPAHEQQRLAALAKFDVMDTPREAVFDELAALVAAICEAPIGVVNLIGDGRQFFKAEVGLGVRETPLETSFCAHALLEEDFLLIPDAAADPRFACSPLVMAEPPLRFYAGALLKTTDGYPIGTLCVLDHRPRSLTDVQVQAIRVLAKQVMVQLEQRRTTRQIAASEARRRAIMDSAQDFAIVATDLDGRIVEWSYGAEYVLGWSKDEVIGKSAALFFTPEDRDADRPAVEMACARKTGRATDERWHIRKGGERFWASGEMSPLLDEDDQHIGYVKIFRDRTEEHLAGTALREAQDRFTMIFNTVEAAFAIVEVKFDAADRPIDYRFLEANPAFERQAGVNLRGKWVTEFAPDLERFWFDTYGHVAKTGEAANFESYAEAFGRWFDVRAVRVGDPADRQIAILFNDVTARREAQDQLAASEALARENIERVQLALQAGAIIGTWHWDIPSDRFTIDDAFAQAFGIDPVHGREGISLHEIVVTVHPDDRTALREAIIGAVASGGAYAHQYRVRYATGEYRWIEANGRVERAADGTARTFPGVLIDIDERRAVEAERDRATAELRANEAKWRGLFETLEEGFVLGKVLRDAEGRIVDWRYEEVNNAWYDLVGIERGCAIGRTIRQLFPGIEDDWVLEFARVVETGEAMRFTRQVGNLQRWYDGVCQAIENDRFTVIFLEVTERVLAEQRREALAELGHSLSVLTDINEMSGRATAIIGQALNATRVGYGTLAPDGETLIVPHDWNSAGTVSLAGAHRLDDFGSYAEDLRQGRFVVIPDIHNDPRTSANTAPLDGLGVRSLVNVPIIENGRTAAVLYVNDAQPRAWKAEEIAFVSDAANRVRSAIERRRAEEDLRESESFMRSVLAASTDCIKVLDLEGNLTFMSEGGMKVMEISDFNAVNGCYWPNLLKDDGVGFGKEALEASRAGHSFHFEAPADTHLGNSKFWSVSVSPIFGENGRVERILSVSRDHTTLEEAREQQRLLNGELSHRLKNVLTIVQSIANQTLRDAATLEDASAAFSSRLASLGRATDVLTATSWEASELSAVLEAGLAAIDGKRDRVSMKGPAIRLNAQSALALTLAIHELGTNALKYGALSSDTGSVTLSWQVTGSKADPEFYLLWQERGGPVVSAPTRRGFGTRLIERSLRSYFRGETSLSYPPEGVEFRIKAPLDGAGELVTA